MSRQKAWAVYSKTGRTVHSFIERERETETDREREREREGGREGERERGREGERGHPPLHETADV